jgi:hypothetical protein
MTMAQMIEFLAGICARWLYFTVNLRIIEPKIQGMAVVTKIKNKAESKYYGAALGSDDM